MYQYLPVGEHILVQNQAWDLGYYCFDALILWILLGLSLIEQTYLSIRKPIGGIREIWVFCMFSSLWYSHVVRNRHLIGGFLRPSLPKHFVRFPDFKSWHKIDHQNFFHYNNQDLQLWSLWCQKCIIYCLLSLLLHVCGNVIGYRFFLTILDGRSYSLLPIPIYILQYY